MSVMVSLVMAASIMATKYDLRLLTEYKTPSVTLPGLAAVMICKPWGYYWTIYMENKKSSHLYIYLLLQFFDLGRGLVGYKFVDNLSQKRYLTENGKMTFEISNYPQHLRKRFMRV